MSIGSDENSFTAKDGNQAYTFQWHDTVGTFFFFAGLGVIGVALGLWAFWCITRTKKCN
jgi:hypothetical protein